MTARLAVTLVCTLVAAFAVLADPATADCPGATSTCPYSSVIEIGQRGGGVLRFPQTVAVGPDGSVYVGDQASHIVQVFNPDGSFQREVGVAGSRPGELSAVGALAVAADNTLLVADGSDRIDRFDASGRLIDTWGSSGTDVGQFHFGAGGGHDAPAGGGLAISRTTVYVSDSRNDRVQRFGLDGSHGAEIVAPGLLANPRGLAVRGTRLIVADDLHHRLAVLDTGGRLLTTVANGPGHGVGQLNSPFGVALDPAGRVFVADDLNHRVVRFSAPPRYPYKARWGSYGRGPGQLAFPRGIATDQRGNVYVTNTGNDRIDVFDRSGTLLRSFGRSGRGPGQFDAPLGVAADASGIRAVADSINGRIELLRPDGSLASSWGSPAPGPTILPNPVAVAFDAPGNAYVLDQRRARIVVFSRETGMPVRTIAALGSGPGRLLEPAALAIDAAGTIYVADAGNRRIARFTTAGAHVGSITGTGTVRGIAVTPDGARIAVSTNLGRIIVYDPSGTELLRFGGRGRSPGRLNAPAQMTFDAAGNLWVADRGNSRVQQFDPNGKHVQMLGTRGIGLGQFIRPTGVSVDCNGLLTVTDTGNNRVQQFALSARVPGPGCAALAPVATPPPPRLPTLPVRIGPQVSLRALRTTSVLRTRTLPLLASCDTGCTISISATVSPRGRPGRRRARATVAFGRVTRRLRAAEPKIVRLQLSRRSVRRLRRALGRRHGMIINVQMQATAPAGPPTDVTKRLQATA